MSRRGERPIVASVEDVDENGNVVEGTDRYASSVAPSSPAKEQPNTGRARNKGRRSSSSPITTSALTDSDSTVHPQRDSKKSSKDRDKSVSKKALMAASRPPVKHAKTTSSIPKRDEASYYGVDPTTITPATSRPRAQTSRPSSYYGPSRPPPANARFYANQPPTPLMTGSLPPHSWLGPGPLPPYPPPSPSPVIMQQPPPPHPDYFTRPPEARPLEARFGSLGSVRPQSSMGFRPSRAAIEYDDYETPPERTLARRPSTTRKVSKGEADRKTMPPPPRPASARPTALAFRPPPSTSARRTVGFEDRDPDDDDPLFRDLSPLAPASYGYTPPMPFRPRPSFGATEASFDIHDFRTEVAGKGHRRHSYYGGHSASSGSAYEEKVRQATRYQDDVAGGSQLPLTAESLRKAVRNGGSSRSTKSSGSHDESSEYRQSATTRTTRSSANNDEDVTIRVKGSTVLKLGNAEFQCQDGAEINISSRGGTADIRASSDRSSYLDQDDRRTRVDIPSARARASSRARSYSRNFAKYDAGSDYDAYDYPQPLPPPYPPYPSAYSSRPDDGYYGGAF
ncbi:hypothetical protein N656DRAFT_796496 [Canariomyces notabilis]|uniref:Uncharacterized protein n=1 Tax=Canariomyces notabilis TaxID=2074819 RepID=A0AAN6TI58_9PEZI|nr:hypothetical protein N656DRAFT_796496 [Canariomyces arenarius]